MNIYVNLKINHNLPNYYKRGLEGLLLIIKDLNGHLNSEFGYIDFNFNMSIHYDDGKSIRLFNFNKFSDRYIKNRTNKSKPE